MGIKDKDRSGHLLTDLLDQIKLALDQRQQVFPDHD
jgi:hypothetical protein